ncbi:hypothetical protein TNCV_2980271 [Trichonephila clavipes]|nr:hypothetical protein TNCV_2980271 [Trichonephila clavipes]
MRRVSRRSELPMAPVQIPDVLEPVQILLVPQSPVQIPVSQVLEPLVQIPVSQVPQSPVQIPDVPEHVQIPVSKVPQSPAQIPPMQIPQMFHNMCRFQCHKSQPPMHIQVPDVPVSQVPQSTCADSSVKSVTSPTDRWHQTTTTDSTYADYADSPRTYADSMFQNDSRCSRTCADSQCRFSPSPRTDSPVQIPVS